MTVIDDHLERFSDPQRTALLRTRDTIRKALPGAAEVISYGMPTFAVDGVAVVGFDGFAQHNSLFPYSGQVVALVQEELPDLPASKGTVRFPLDEQFPARLLTRIVKLRMTEINESYPKRSGEYKEFSDKGRLLVSGRLRDGVRTGAWRWYRNDGSLRRSGSYRAGKETGTWTTYDRSGTPTARTPGP